MHHGIYEIPPLFKALIVSPTNSGETKYLVEILSNEFRGKFDYVILLCPTYTFNRIYQGFAKDDRFLHVVS